jgi:hypothetical protein
VESVTAYVVTATAASSHVHVQPTTYAAANTLTYAPAPTYAPSASPVATSANNGTLVTYTGAAGRVEAGVMAVVGLVAGVAFLL